MTEVFLLRHSKNGIKEENTNNNDNLQLRNEKSVLSIEGEQESKKISEIEELQNIDLVISSHYVRAVSTAKYIANKNNTVVNIISDFGERRFGINDWSELPEDFEQRQFDDDEFKMSDGENRREVTDRVNNALMKVLRENKDKKVAIVSHATAITFLFMKYGEYRDKKLYFGEKLLIDKDYKWRAPEVWKLVFDKETLVSIENIRKY